jgi:hypothetical protein
MLLDVPEQSDGFFISKLMYRGACALGNYRKRFRQFMKTVPVVLCLQFTESFVLCGELKTLKKEAT